MQIEFRPRSRLKPESAFLSQFARSVTSQEGEDGIIEKIFEIVPPAHRYCVEIGAYDGKVLSNTWNLIVNHGWRDGELIVAGYQKLHWPNLAFTQEEIQVLPRALRRYGLQLYDSMPDTRAETDAANKGA